MVESSNAHEHPGPGAAHESCGASADCAADAGVTGKPAAAAKALAFDAAAAAADANAAGVGRHENTEMSMEKESAGGPIANEWYHSGLIDRQCAESRAANKSHCSPLRTMMPPTKLLPTPQAQQKP